MSYWKSNRKDFNTQKSSKVLPAGAPELSGIAASGRVWGQGKGRRQKPFSAIGAMAGCYHHLSKTLDPSEAGSGAMQPVKKQLQRQKRIELSIRDQGRLQHLIIRSLWRYLKIIGKNYRSGGETEAEQVKDSVKLRYL